MYKEYLKQKWEWVDSNPRTAAWLGWVKGIIVGILLTLLLSGCGSTQSIPSEGCCSHTGVKNTSVQHTKVNIGLVEKDGVIVNIPIPTITTDTIK